MDREVGEASRIAGICLAMGGVLVLTGEIRLTNPSNGLMPRTAHFHRRFMLVCPSIMRSE